MSATCWRCGFDAHDDALTLWVAAMWETKFWDPAYDYASDTTPVICPGTGTAGPARFPIARLSYCRHAVDDGRVCVRCAELLLHTSAFALTACRRPVAGFVDGQWQKVALTVS